jgi:hypothetical protein
MASTQAEYEAQLVNVKAAIVRAENAQSYSVAGRQKTNAILDTLYKRQDELEKKIDNLARGGIRIQGIIAH